MGFGERVSDCSWLSDHAGMVSAEDKSGKAFCDHSAGFSSVAVGLDFVASVFPLFVWEEDSFLPVSVPNCRVTDEVSTAEPFRNDGIRQLVFGCCHSLRQITLEEPQRVVSWTQTRELRPNDRFNIVAAFIFCF